MNVLVEEDRLSVNEKRRHSVILQVQSSSLSFVPQLEFDTGKEQS